MVKNDKWIRKMALKHKMIEPFETDQIRDGKISFGTSSYGYDMRLSNEFIIVKKNTVMLDPKKLTESSFESVVFDNYIEVFPNSIILGKTIEYFKIPKNIITIAFGKSTYARCGIFVNITPFEPEWEGYVTLSILNATSYSVKIYANEGIAQILFLETSEVCDISYADKKGKYQTQKNITLAKI
jgi:dCTP deaminase